MKTNSSGFRNREGRCVQQLRGRTVDEGGGQRGKEESGRGREEGKSPSSQVVTGCGQTQLRDEPRHWKTALFLRKQKDQAHGQTIIRRLARASSEKGVTRDTRPANEKKPLKGRGGGRGRANANGDKER